MAQPEKHDAMVLRARLEFPVWHRAFIKSYTAWTNAPSDLKGPMLLSGQALARAETWLIEFPDKLTDSQKRFIVRSIAQRAKQPAASVAKPAAQAKARWQWRRSSDRNLWQVLAVIVVGGWVFAPDYMTDILERSINSPEAYEIARRQQVQLTMPESPPASVPNLVSADDVQVAPKAAAELPPLLQDITAPRASPPPPPPPGKAESMASLALDRLRTQQARTGLLLAIESAELQLAEMQSPPPRASSAEPEAGAPDTPQPELPLARTPPSALLMQAIATREVLAPLSLRTATSKAAIICADSRGIVAMTAPAQLTAWTSAAPATRSLTNLAIDSVASIALDPECRRVLVPNEDFNVEIRSLAQSAPAVHLVGHEAPITASAFDPTGTAIVTASQDTTARVWDARSGRQRAILNGHEWHVIDARFSPDGKRIVTASADHTARLWNSATGDLVGILPGHQGSVTSARFSADGRSILTTSWDGFVRIFDVATRQLQVAIKHANSGLVTAALNRDGDRVATTNSEGAVQLWTIEPVTGARQISALPLNARNVSFSPDGRWLAVHDWYGNLAIHHASDGAHAVTFSDQQIHIHDYAFVGNDRVVVLSETGIRYTWPILTTQQAALDHALSIAPPCLTADERTLLGLDAEIPAWCSQIKPRGAALPR